MKKRVPSKDYALHYQQLWPELGPEIERVIREENPILGASVQAFEQEFGAYVGTEFAIGVSSGTDALILALRCLGVGPGDEVVTAANTFAATVTAILTVGARPVLVDPDPETYTLTAGAVAGALSPRTRAVIPVHLYGRLCEMDALVELCAGRDVPVVEDAAQAHGASQGTAAGAWGAFGCFSFHPSKNLSGFGDGGIVTTNQGGHADTLRELRNLGKRGKYDFAHVAPNAKLDTLQAAILSCKLRHLDRWNDRRRALAARYTTALADLEAAGRMQLPPPLRAAEHVFHLFAVHTERRDELRQALADAGIRAGMHYPIPPHLQSWPVDLGYAAGDFPVAEASAQRQLSLPIAPELTDDQIDLVATEVHAFFA